MGSNEGGENQGTGGVASNTQQGGEGSSQSNASSNWKDTLPSELAANPALKDVQDVASLAKQFVDSQAYMGRSVRIPTEDEGAEAMSKAMQKIIDKVPGLMPKPNPDDPEQYNLFLKSLGVPDEPDSYEVPEVEGIDPNPDRDGYYKQLAHKNGLTDKQFKGLMKDILDADIKFADEAKQLHDDDMAALNREWGNATDEKRDQIAAFAEKTGAPEGIHEMLLNGTAGSGVYKWLDKVIGMMGKEGAELSKQLPTVQGRTADEIKEEIRGIQDNKDGPYWVASDPDHKRMVDKVVKLHQELAKIEGTDK